MVQERRRIFRSRAWHFALKHMALVKAILRDPRREINLLDLGCASGYLRRFLEGNLPSREQKLVYYQGLDARIEPLLAATLQTGSIESGASGKLTPSMFVHHDVCNGLPFVDTRFDLVVAFEFLKYLDQGTGVRLIQELRRVCRPDGRLVLSMPTNFLYEREVHPGRMSALEPNELTQLLTAAGFKIEHVRGSQSTFHYISEALEEDHRNVFEALSEVLPEEIVAAFFTPLYPRHSTQLTYSCRPT